MSTVLFSHAGHAIIEHDQDSAKKRIAEIKARKKAYKKGQLPQAKRKLVSRLLQAAHKKADGTEDNISLDTILEGRVGSHHKGGAEELVKDAGKGGAIAGILREVSEKLFFLGFDKAHSSILSDSKVVKKDKGASKDKIKEIQNIVLYTYLEEQEELFDGIETNLQYLIDNNYIKDYSKLNSFLTELDGAKKDPSYENINKLIENYNVFYKEGVKKSPKAGKILLAIGLSLIALAVIAIAILLIVFPPAGLAAFMATTAGGVIMGGIALFAAHVGIVIGFKYLRNDIAKLFGFKNKNKDKKEQQKHIDEIYKEFVEDNYMIYGFDVKNSAVDKMATEQKQGLLSRLEYLEDKLNTQYLQASRDLEEVNTSIKKVKNEIKSLEKDHTTKRHELKIRDADLKKLQLELNSLQETKKTIKSKEETLDNMLVKVRTNKSGLEDRLALPKLLKDVSNYDEKVKGLGSKIHTASKDDKKILKAELKKLKKDKIKYDKLISEYPGELAEQLLGKSASKNADIAVKA